VTARRLRARIHHFDTDVPIHRLLNHHAAKLSSAQHAETQGWSNGR
jgi:hypothetical protein